jgi:DNA-binding NtrC family response regulator
MARVFIQTENIEIAVPVREAVLADGHDVEMVDSVEQMEVALRPDDEDTALVLTAPAESRSARQLVALFNVYIPRPPVIAFAETVGAAHGRAGQLWQGPDECLGLPPDDTETLVVLEEQLSRYRLQRETGIVGRTETIREVLGRIELIAPVNSTVLITGESGTGKELVARALHGLSPRRTRSFIALNMGAIPETLLESELFGHEKGAFTGATSRRKGMFELADGGTLLLDEIAEMPWSLQTRLLRVLETKRFMRVGGDVEIAVDVRVIAATNRDLRAAVERGEFRRDLYHRLNVLNVEMPPLRRRKPDIPILVRKFVKEISATHNREFKGLAPDAMDILLEYDWPGNVRELRNLVESMVVLAPGDVIRAEDIPAEIRYGSGRASLTLPAMRGVVGSETGGAMVPAGSAHLDAVQPKLEFIFRTLVDMKIDLEDLRGEFDRYRLRGGASEAGDGVLPSMREPIVIDAVADAGDADGAGQTDGPVTEPAEGVLLFDPDMTMADLEREAIRHTLNAVGGNRRKAAERLQIGERTLYRKLREYEIET